MDQRKQFIVDTNVLLEDPECIRKLRNGIENDVFVPYHVLLELNKLKKDARLAHIAAKVVKNLLEDRDKYVVLDTDKVAEPFQDLVDGYILDEVQRSGLAEPILVTNDKILQLLAAKRGIKSEFYRESVPFKSDAEYFTGFVASREERVPNCFFWEEGKPVFWGRDEEGRFEEKAVSYQHKVWNVTPRNVYQNLAIELLTNPCIDVVSIQSEAGYGKSFLALAAALHLVLERKDQRKIYVVKPMIEIGQKLGYLPGGVEEKMEPYTRYVGDLMSKLHATRPANRLFLDAEQYPPKFDPKKFELLPLNYIRGMTIENAVVIIDEMQNMSRSECRALLSRMGEGVKCFCLGDIRQVDHPYLNQENNGLNWLVKKFKGAENYAHLVLKGEKSRGPITDLVIKSGL
ncbi:PhoH family protein [Desulfocurvibacter africanus]|uniref:PhoH family protein n=1 Tax=Desulfocurvibacter africanus subsp. africanus str. Walvis Bay TaxID=690850 RepID=F3YWD1_DESAF|nr:PhoH family protein [Desulfocurvibacter africanus]EGJ49317.1 PhoH family protein [Desulfocurvibacter africanus subsp. africanus str. Walvis Bay]